MSYDKYSYYVLCEDNDHFTFVYSYLKKKGANGRRINLAKEFPRGRGSGKKFVELSYAEEVRKINQRPENTVLIVLCDIDKENDEDVVDSFATKNKKVFIAFPKRNIETWFYFFANRSDPSSTDEMNDRKGLPGQNSKYKPSWCGEQFVDIINGIKNGQSPLHLPPSLSATAERVIEYEKDHHC